MARKSDSRLSDTRRIKGCGNVFRDLGFAPAEAKIMADSAHAVIAMESEAGFFSRIRRNARRLDRNEGIPAGTTVSCEDRADAEILSQTERNQRRSK